jgi:hypothetical protein
VANDIDQKASEVGRSIEKINQKIDVLKQMVEKFKV